MMLGRRVSSMKLYDTYMRRWKTYCVTHDIPILKASIAQGLAFLQTLVHQGLGYSAVNTARSALSAVLIFPNGVSFGSHSDVTLYMKGVFNLRPTRPKYVSTWDPSQVLLLLESWSPAVDIPIERLTMKVIM
jgi:hypothetical protein